MVWGVERDNNPVVIVHIPKHMAYPWQLPSAQPAWAGALRRADRPTWRFQEDMEVRIDAYESWEYPLFVAKILDMDHIFSYLWIRIFISGKF